MSMSVDTILEITIAILRHLESKDIVSLRKYLYSYSNYHMNDIINKNRQNIINLYFNKTTIDNMNNINSLDMDEDRMIEDGFYNNISSSDEIRNVLEQMSLAIQSTYTDSEVVLYNITNDIKVAANTSDLIKDYISLTTLSKSINDTLKFNDDNIKENNNHIKYYSANSNYMGSVLKLQASNLKNIINIQKLINEIVYLFDYCILITNTIPDIHSLVDTNTNQYLKELFKNDERFAIN